MNNTNERGDRGIFSLTLGFFISTSVEFETNSIFYMVVIVFFWGELDLLVSLFGEETFEIGCKN